MGKPCYLYDTEYQVIEENNIVDELANCGWKLKLGMSFASEQVAYDFYNTSGGKVDFSTCNIQKKLDKKIYLRLKRQKDLEYGEASSALQYFRKKTMENPSFYYAVQLDSEE